jgi:hypothetical protein
MIDSLVVDANPLLSALLSALLRTSWIGWVRQVAGQGAVGGVCEGEREARGQQGWGGSGGTVRWCSWGRWVICAGRVFWREIMNIAKVFRLVSRIRG